MKKVESTVNQLIDRRQSVRVKYPLYGALLGSSLPVAAMWLNIAMQSLPVSVTDIFQVFQVRAYPLSWTVAVVSILLGGLTGLVGGWCGRLVQLNAELSTTNAALQAEVAERQQAAEVLRQTEARYQSLFEHASDGIACFTVDGVFTSVNREAEKILERVADD